MINLMNKIRRRIFPLIGSFFPGIIYSDRSYSQEGEDMVLKNIFMKHKGFYVDIGAHHPYRFSNTYFFYKKGWSGINIDPRPNTKRLFDKERPLDTNIEVGIGSKKGVLKYHEFNEPALNSFSDELSNQRNNSDIYKIINESEIEVCRLEEILEKYLKKNQEIDFMNIDVEGNEISVLQSNNWIKYRPKCILIEILNGNLEEIKNDPAYSFLNLQGYELFAKTGNTVIFIR